MQSASAYGQEDAPADAARPAQHSVSAEETEENSAALPEHTSVYDQVNRQGDIRRAGASVRLDVLQADDVWVAGALVDIKGVVRDNLWVAAGQVVINAKAGEDVWAVGGDVTINADAGGGLIGMGGRVAVQGNVTRNAYLSGADIVVNADVRGKLDAAGAFVRVGPESHVGGKAWLAGSFIVFDGDARELSVTGDTVEINGTVRGNADINARRLTLGPGAQILGNLSYRGLTPMDRAQTARVSGEVEQEIVSEREVINNGPQSWEPQSVARNFLEGGLFLTMTLGAFFFGLVFYIIFPAMVSRLIATLRSRPAKSLGYGFLVFFLTPIVAVLLLFTVIGLPLGFVTFSLYPVLLFFGYVVAAFGLSDIVFNPKAREAGVARRLLEFAGGLLVLGIFFFIPFLGGWLLFLALLMGLGAASLTIFSGWRHPAQMGENAGSA